MFSRIFNIHGKKDTAKEDSGKEWQKKLDEFQALPRLPKLDKSKIRVLMFKDSERRSDKSLLFDSDAIVSVDSESHLNVSDNRTKIPKMADSPASPSPQKYQCLKPNGDVKVLGEMIFGSVAMVYKGSVLKVHLMRTPPQLLMTKVFALRSRSAGVNFCDGELSVSGSINAPQIHISSESIMSDSMHESPEESMIRSYSNPIGMNRNIRNQSFHSLNASSTFGMSSWNASSDNLTRSTSLASLHGTPLHSPCGSYQRRFFRSQRTSLDSPHMWRTKSEISEEIRSAHKQQPKIGVGVIFKLWDNNDDNRAFQNFYFTHYALFESHLQTLRVKIEKSFYLRQRFIDAAMSAVECFKDDIMRLCYAPRIIEPVWLNLMAVVENKYHESVEKFMNNFMQLINICEKKENNYFLSILLTAVLTHHTSWVATVMASGSAAKRAYLDKHSSKTLDVLAKCHPYNPLWAQLCDLYGSTGAPLKLARTIVVGKNAHLVCELLKLLTYFIRCSDIKENYLRMEKESDTMFRFSGSSWNESYFSKTPSTPNSVRSWIDTNTPVHKENEKNDDTPVENKIAKVSETDLQVTPRSLEKQFFDTAIDTSSCYCRVLQQLDMIGEKNLTNFLKNSDNKNIKELLDVTDDGAGPHSKSCKNCRTLEKPIFAKFCDACRKQQRNVGLEIDPVCHHCVQRLEKTQQILNSPPTKIILNSELSNCGKNGYSTETLKSLTLKDSLCLPKKPSFKCYCCPLLNENQNVIITCEESEHPSDLIPRVRTASDPVDVTTCKIKPGYLRNSTTSHDSGTEMAYSVSSSSHDLESTDSLNLTRNNSLSSQDDLLNSEHVPDLDSDYCSIDNEQFVTNDANDCDTLENNFRQVSKSASSTTLKELPLVLSTSLDNNDSIEEEETDVFGSVLNLDLENMNLRELPLARTHHKPSRKHSRPAGNETVTFGKSLFAGYNDEYVPNFVLQGTRNLDRKRLATDLQNSVKYSVLDEEVSDAVCIVADTDTWSCDLWTLAKRTDSFNQSTSESLNTKPVFASGLVSSMVESTKELWDMKMSPHFCLLHVEEQLKDIYNRSKVLSEFACCNNEKSTSAFMNGFGYHANDILLLNSIGGIYSSSFVDSMLE